MTVAMSCGTSAFAQEGKQEVDGKYFDKEEEPTYNVKEDGTVDWYTYSGFRRYHSECHVCHGPDGLGSTYAPALADSMKTMEYGDFISVVASGKERITSSETSKMPAFGDNVNVYCYMDDIYVYLKARADEAVPRGRPRKRDKKPEQATAYENECREGT
ncbi:MAG: c-type cytochrome, methanol metabolism-related [Hyphomicrobiales bacterium]|nr:c-type cytochrome, methanol metabolism-related [Hyphomicrobiales bacterium]